ncbi:hypothetical protein SMSP1_00574 [Sedimentisphaera salicampi]|nr:hypothetical protein SMSP1_00574 [Sedimentisphaera salicampi]
MLLESETLMPTISMFYGIIVRMYCGVREHNPPHIHIYYQDCKALFDIRNAEVMEGNLPNRQTKLVLAWIEIHKEELLANWELAQNGEVPFKIEPLR